MTMIAKLNAHEATIQTASVSVKALTIEGRQVTLAVFRQLKDERLLSNEGHLAGIPWGTINYFWGDCSKKKPHLHVVWQKEDELRRSCVFPQDEPVASEHFWELSQAYLQLKIIEERWWPRDKFGTHLSAYQRTRFGWRYWWVMESSLILWKELDEYVSRYNKQESELSAIFEARKKEISLTFGMDGIENLKTACQSEELKLLESHARYLENFSTLSKLEQLFIAV